jgi:hypothetical protein
MQTISGQSSFLHLLQHASRQGADKCFPRAKISPLDLPIKADALDKTKPLEQQKGQPEEEDIKR